MLRATIAAVVLCACDPAAILADPGSALDSRKAKGYQELNEMAEAQRAKQAEENSATHAAAEARVAANARKREDEERDWNEHKRAIDGQSLAAVKSHAEECASTYRKRFIDMQTVMVNLPEIKKKAAAECARLATHCSTMTGGHSYCHGITGRDQQRFDEMCSVWPNYTVTLADDEACADVDPQHLIVNFGWSAEDMTAFSKQKPPP